MENNQINIFIKYDGNHSIEKMLKKLDETSPYFSAVKDNGTENYLIRSDLKLPPEVLEKIWLSALVYPYKENKKLTDFKHIISFYNFPTQTSCSEIQKMLEERGFIFKSISENLELIKKAFEWYRPIDSEAPKIRKAKNF